MIELVQGDCLEKMADIPDGSIDMVMTDPPYGTTACKWDSVIPFEQMWEQLRRVTKPTGAIVLMASQPFTTALIASNFQMFRYEYIWLKERGQNFMLAKKQFMKAHENVLVFYAKQPTYNPQMTEAPADNIRKPQRHTAHKSEVYGGLEKRVHEDYDPKKRYPLSYKLFKVGRARDRIHPTQKPVALMEYLIRTYTDSGERVLDFAAGSFTTAIACINLGRSFVGIELDPIIFARGQERVREHQRERP